MTLNNRNGLIAVGVVAALAIIFAVIQSSNLSTTTNQLTAAQNTATAQVLAMANQGTAGASTLSAAGTRAADSQQSAVSDAVNAGATAQAGTATRAAVAAATSEANAVSSAKNAAATAQAVALNDAVNAAATAQAQALAAASRAAATAQASAVNNAKNTAATSLAQTLTAEATEQAESLATLKAQTTATLGAVVNAAATAEASAVADARNEGATAQAAAVSTAESKATATLGALIHAQADTQRQYQNTQVAAATEIASLNDQLATAQAQPSATLPPTATLVPTTVPTEQATAISPTSEGTAEATAAVSGVPENWKRFVGKGVAIQLPDTFVGNELGADPEALTKLLQSLGPDFAAAAQLFESNPDILSLIAVNPATSSNSFAANVIIVSVPLPTNIPIETLLNATVSQLPSASTVREKDVVQLNGQDVGRMIVETKAGGIDSIQLQYYIIADNTFYLVAFTGSPGHFDEQVPMFEQSIKTFEILATPGA